jgi:hypothetical protein
MASETKGRSFVSTGNAAQDFFSSLLVDCGELAHIRRLVEAERYGLATTTFLKPNYLVIETTAGEREMDERELGAGIDIEDHFEDRHRSLTELGARLDRYVRIHDNWFISYDPDNEDLTEYMEMADERRTSFAEAQALPPGTRLGHRSFREWNNVATTAQGRVLHHIACSTRLSAGRPELDLRNLLTVYARKDDMLAVWEQSGQPPLTAQLLLSLMTLDADSARQHEIDHEIPLPYYVDLGRDFVLLPCFGALLNPYAGVVRRLRTTYRPDWDRGVGAREGMFRDMLRSAFPTERFIVPDRGFTIRVNGQPLTDIDAVVLDRRTGSLALIQLKWHDIFGRSLRERNSRILNLLAANRWVERLSQWIGSRTAREISIALDIGEAANRPPVLFVVTRHATRFTGVNSLDERAAWLGWARLLAATRNSTETDPLQTVFDAFRAGGTDDPPAVKPHKKTFSFQNLTVEVHVD